MNAIIKQWVIPPCAGFLVGLALGAYLEHRSPQPVALQSDKQLIETTRELGAERVEQAKTQAVAKRAAVAKAVRDEVARDTGDADLAGWFNERAGGD
jgi:hypothetical protein